MRKWRANNPDYDRHYYAENREYIALRKWAYHQMPHVLLERRVRERLRRDGVPMLASFKKIVGLNSKAFAHHIASQFRNGMTWDNHGIEWELDHIKPVRFFDQRTLRGQMAAHHCTNWQPLLVDEHRAKTTLERRTEEQRNRLANDLGFWLIKAVFNKPRTVEEQKAARQAYYMENRTRILESQKTSYGLRRARIQAYWQNISPEKRAERNARRRAWGARNKERIAAANKAWWKKKKEVSARNA
jgi:hypothetical protein